MANPHCPLQKLFPHLLTVSFSGFLLSSETHLAKITISTSCYSHGKMNPDVWNTEPVAALLSYAEMTVSQIRALLPAVPDFGGPCQNKGRVLPAFCWKCGTYLLFQLVLPHSAGHHSAAVSRLTCGWKSCRIKKEAQRHVSETLKNQEHYQDSNMVSLYSTFWRDYLAVLFQWHTVIVLLSSLKVSVNQREWMGINCTLWAVENVWYNVSFP